MRTIIHDLDVNDSKYITFDEEDKIINSLECCKSCIGCFSCWVKHPKKCALNDEFSNNAEYLKDSDEFIIISKCRYGCYSGSTKRLLERCIGYVLPYFTIRNNEIHHESRYDKKLKLSVYFYGYITDEDKEVTDNLVRANSVNLNASDYEIKYFDNLKEIDKCIH